MQAQLIVAKNMVVGLAMLALLGGCGSPGDDDSSGSNSSTTPVAPSLSLSANPTTVVTNGSTTLSWDSDNADQCTASGDWSGSRGLSGSEVFTGITSNRQFTLTCQGPGGSISETVNVAHTTGNIAPVANAGPDQNVISGNQVNLNGNGSSDANGDPLTFTWTLTSTPAGSSASFVNATSPTPSFVADLDGSYVVSLVVNDGTVASNPDNVVIVASGSSSSYDCTSNTVHCVDDSAGANQEYSIIQNAVNISQPGDVVLVFDGNYAGFRVSSSGTSTQRITIVADGNNANIVSSEPFGNNAIRIEASSNITIDGFQIDRSGFSAGSSYNYACIAARGASAPSPMRNLSFVNNHLANCAPAGMYLSNVKNLNIAGNTILNTDDVSGIQGMGIYLANASVDDAVVVENKISGSEGVAIHMNGDSSIGGDGIQKGHQIRRNVFENNGSNGLNMDGVQDVLIENNLFANNIKHGIRGYRIDGGGGPLNWIIVNNTFYNNESAIKATEDVGGHVIFNNVIVSNINNGFLMNGANFSESNNVYSNSPNAVFVNAAGSDLRLNATSSAVNGGTTTFQANNAPGDDISGALRSGTPDVGAFEFGSNYPNWY